MSHHSIAETCFFVKPTVLSSRKRKREHCPPTHRQEALNRQLATLDENVNALLETENVALIQEIVDVMQEPAHIEMNARMRCGLVISGNDTNTDRLYQHVSSRLSSSSRVCPMVHLMANDCVNIRSTMRSIVLSTVAQCRPIRNLSRLQSYDLRLVEAWATHQVLAENESVTVVIAMHNIETFSPTLVDELVNTLSACSIDFRILCNVSTSLIDLQDVFYGKTTRKLHVTQFQQDPDESTLDKIVVQQLITRSDGLRLGFTAYSSLLRNYRTVNRSPDQFTSAIKYVYICHFFANPLAVLLDPKNTVDTVACEIIRSLPSFRYYVNKVGSTENLKEILEVRDALLKDSALRSIYERFVVDINVYKTKLSSAMTLFFVCRKHSKLGLQSKSCAELYLELLDRGLKDSGPVKELLLCIKVMRTESLVEVFNECIDEPELESSRQVFQSFLHELKVISEMSETLEGNTKKSHEARRLELGWKDPRSIAEKQANMKVKQLKSGHEIVQERSTRHTFISQKRAAETAKHSLTEKEQRFTSLIDRVHEHFAGMFDNLTNHEHLPLHELFWYDFAKPHTAAFNPDIRLHLRSALSDHTTFLGQNCPEPQTSALFRLFQDSGQLINLYDWFQAFKQIYAGNAPDQILEDGSQKSEKAEEEEVAQKIQDRIQQALFMKSLAELKFLGLFKATKRKTDHVQKSISIL